MLGREFFVVLSLFIVMATSAHADIVVASRIIKAQEILTAADLVMGEGEDPNLISTPSDIVGMEARITLYAGRAIRIEDLVRPAVVDRNQTVEMIYTRGALTISASGRSLDRAATGETIRVINNSSRITVSARVTAPGRVSVLSN